MNASIRVFLSQELREAAYDVARQRNCENRAHDQPDGNVTDSLQADIDGAWGELACAGGLGLPWTGRFFRHAEWQSYRHGGADVGDYQVRATRCPHGRLILHDSDPDVPFVFATVHMQQALVMLHGWLGAADGRRDGRWEDVGHGRPCYYVGRELLRPIDALNGVTIPEGRVTHLTLETGAHRQ